MTAPAKIRFCVLASARTGSNWLCSALNDHPGVLCQNELFHQREILFADDIGPPTQFNVRFWHYSRHILPRAFLSRIERQAGSFRAFGFKLFPEHGWRKVAMVCADPTWKIIFLTRRNRLAQFSSLKIAQASGLWSEKRHEKERPADAISIQFDPKDYDAYVTANEENDRRVRSYLKGRDYCSLAYEELGENMDRAFDFLGLNPPADRKMRGNTLKQNSDELLSRFTNPDDVVQALRERGEEQMLE